MEASLGHGWSWSSLEADLLPGGSGWVHVRYGGPSHATEEPTAQIPESQKSATNAQERRLASCIGLMVSLKQAAERRAGKADGAWTADRLGGGILPRWAADSSGQPPAGSAFSSSWPAPFSLSNQERFLAPLSWHLGARRDSP